MEKKNGETTRPPIRPISGRHMKTPMADRERRRTRRPRRAGRTRAAGTASATEPCELIRAPALPALVTFQFLGRPLHGLLGRRATRGDLADHGGQPPLVVDLHTVILRRRTA